MAELSSALSGRGHDVTVLTSDSDVPKSTPKVEQWNNVTIRRLRTRWKAGHWIVCPDAQEILEGMDCDIFHVQSYRNYFSQVAAKIARRRNIPFVLTARGSLLGYRYVSQTRLSWLPNVAFDLATRKRTLRDANVITTTRSESDDALRIGVAPNRIRLIPHGMEMKSKPPPDPKLTTGRNLLFVGRITNQRNLEFLLKGFALALSAEPELRLRIVGDSIPSKYSFSERGYTARIRLLAFELGIEQKVRFLGGIYGPSLWNVYRGSDVFVYPARYDNFGFALLESAYFGLPIVSTPVGIAPELRELSGGVLIAPHNDVPRLSASIVKACVDVDWRRRGSLALHETAKLFSIERNAGAHESLYQALVQTDLPHDRSESRN